MRRRTPELLAHDFQRVHDEIVLMLNQAEQTFSELLFTDNNGGNPVPRYFQTVFLAFHDLIIEKNMIVSDRTGLVERLRNSGRNITIQEGGRWGAENRSAAVQSVVGMVQARFEEGVSETLCMRLSPCGFDGSFIEPFWV